MPSEPDISPAELEELAAILGETFIQRRDLYGRQLEDGSYILVRERLTPAHLRDHLLGRVTLSAYVLDPESRGRYLVLDADDEPDRRRLAALAGALAELEAATYLEGSRRGGHLWLFFERPLPGREIRLFGRGLLAHFGIADIELFPKQDRLRTGPGSAIRLPFGVHRKSGRRYGFITAAGRPLASSLRDQIRILARPAAVPAGVVARFSALAPARPERGPRPAQGTPGRQAALPAGASLAERVRAAVPVRQFVEPYVSLSRGGKGICPFHDDQIPSFYVNDERNFWYCFACEEGGSIIDFWMKRQDLGFAGALEELAARLLP